MVSSILVIIEFKLAIVRINFFCLFPFETSFLGSKYLTNFLMTVN